MHVASAFPIITIGNNRLPHDYGRQEVCGIAPSSSYPGDCGNVAIRLTRDVAVDPPRALFQLAHEACHLISASGHTGNAPNLVEFLLRSWDTRTGGGACQPSDALSVQVIKKRTMRFSRSLEIDRQQSGTSGPSNRNSGWSRPRLSQRLYPA